MTLRPRSKKPDSLSSLIKEADEVFSEWVRRSSADSQGYITCFITGERVYWKDADAAHFVGRSKMATRYHERNVHATTRDSNRFDPDHQTKYYLKMDEKYGWQVRQEIEELSRSLMKFTRSDIIDIIDVYKAKIQGLAK
jgi:hypothetical protein